VNHLNFLLSLTVSAAVLGWGKSGALVTVWNIYETQPCLQLHRVRVAQRDDRNLSKSKGTLKEGSAFCVDADDVVGLPKAEARRRFILNKIYLV